MDPMTEYMWKSLIDNRANFHLVPTATGERYFDEIVDSFDRFVRKHTMTLQRTCRYRKQAFDNIIDMTACSSSTQSICDASCKSGAAAAAFSQGRFG